jgi:predicted DNA-binding protein (MmcQ/YjbR family)
VPVPHQEGQGGVPAAHRLARAEAALREQALAYPETKEEFPWGHSALKVKGKTFLFLYREASFFSLSVKLPVSGRAALGLPFASPTAYGLGKSGWVTARFSPSDEVPLDLLREWVDESFRAVAPKRVLARLENDERWSTRGAS